MDECNISPTNREIGFFLSDYATLLLGSGATCIRLEKNVNRMAFNWNVNVSMAIMPRHIHMSVINNDGGCETFISSINRSVISYDIITQLSKLSWAVRDTNMSLSTARDRLAAIQSLHNANRWWVLFAATCANASFCRLFGGDGWAMTVVLAATAAGFYLRQTLLSAKCDLRLTFLLCAMVSSILAAACSLFGLGYTPDVAMATSVLYLVPGIPFLNAFSDLIDRHYICSFSRMTDAIVLTCCLSTGLCIGMWLMNAGMF